MPTQERGYITDVLTRHAVDFIRGRGRQKGKPFYLYLAHKAIHPNVQQAADGSVQGSRGAEAFIVAEPHRSLYDGARSRAAVTTPVRRKTSRLSSARYPASSHSVLPRPPTTRQFSTACA
ncbi:MAG: hypothetical protein FJW31_18510 [Acidobacteria bacterium]|nr:hypothetical protein [Acidobacteriota bacterium]